MTFVRLNTSMGDIVIELAVKTAPVTSENFLSYVKSGHYDGTIFHRVIAGFMIQGGGMDVDMNEVKVGEKEPIQNEANNGLKNHKYAVAMARTSDPHSATDQFFINTHENEFLNFTGETPRGWGYAVFGRVVEGKAVVDKIENVDTLSRSYHDDVPEEPVIINKAEVLPEDYEPSWEK